MTGKTISVLSNLIKRVAYTNDILEKMKKNVSKTSDDVLTELRDVTADRDGLRQEVGYLKGQISVLERVITGAEKVSKNKPNWGTFYNG